MKKFIVNSVWLIAAVPFYALILLCTAWRVLVINNFGCISNDTEPYEWIYKINEYVYNKIKDKLLS